MIWDIARISAYTKTITKIILRLHTWYSTTTPSNLDLCSFSLTSETRVKPFSWWEFSFSFNETPLTSIFRLPGLLPTMKLGSLVAWSGAISITWDLFDKSYHSHSDSFSVAYCKLRNTRTQSYGTQNTGGTPEHWRKTRKLAEHWNTGRTTEHWRKIGKPVEHWNTGRTTEHWRNNGNTTGWCNMRRAAE